MEELYFRIYGDYAGRGPVFVPREECPWLAEVERHWRTIRQEFEDVHARSPEQLTASFVPDDVDIRGWRSVNFVTYLHWYPRNCARFPRTVEILRSIPDLTSAFVNLLEPHSSLPAHNGDTNATYRCHLGLIVPGGVDECGLEAGGERTGWEEGETFAFNEAFRHHVWNRTGQDRVVLVFDVLRPEYRPRKLEICSGVLAAMALTALETRFRLLRGLSDRARRVLHRLLAVGARAVLVLRDGVR